MYSKATMRPNKLKEIVISKDGIEIAVSDEGTGSVDLKSIIRM